MTCLGNISLLDQEKHGFLCSRCTQSSVILPCLDWAVAHARGDTAVMSTFHSELESAILDLLIPGRCPIILVLGRRLYSKVPERLKPLLDADRPSLFPLATKVASRTILPTSPTNTSATIPMPSPSVSFRPAPLSASCASPQKPKESPSLCQTVLSFLFPSKLEGTWNHKDSTIDLK